VGVAGNETGKVDQAAHIKTQWGFVRLVGIHEVRRAVSRIPLEVPASNLLANANMLANYVGSFLGSTPTFHRPRYGVFIVHLQILTLYHNLIVRKTSLAGQLNQAGRS
jgi:hypothetical protein